MNRNEWLSRNSLFDKEEESLSASSTSCSDSCFATQQAVKQYIENVDESHIAGMIYAMLMKDKIEQEKLDKLVDARPDKEQLFTDKEFEI